MHDRLLRTCVKLEKFMRREQGQDLVEYGLPCTLTALMTISSVNPIATVVLHFFGNVCTTLAWVFEGA
jgi:Flp pilus assembly pilin Flp